MRFTQILGRSSWISIDNLPTDARKLKMETQVLAPVDKAAAQIAALYVRAKRGMIDGLKYYIECGVKLKSVKDSLLHGEWLPWLENNREVLGFGEKTAPRLIKAANISLTRHSDELGEDEAYILNRQIWGNSPDNHRALGTGENDWHTPMKYIEAARAVMGQIDLDPASSQEAQRHVKALYFKTPEQDGLSCEWKGRIWLNPPYSQPAIANFIAKLVSEHDQQKVTEAILLTHNYTDTSWFHNAERHAALICFTAGRIHFVLSDGTEASPTQGQAFFYFGKNRVQFKKVFSKYGFIR